MTYTDEIHLRTDDRHTANVFVHSISHKCIRGNDARQRSFQYVHFAGVYVGQLRLSWDFCWIKKTIYVVQLRLSWDFFFFCLLKKKAPKLQLQENHCSSLPRHSNSEFVSLGSNGIKEVLPTECSWNESSSIPTGVRWQNWIFWAELQRVAHCSEWNSSSDGLLVLLVTPDLLPAAPEIPKFAGKLSSDSTDRKFKFTMYNRGIISTFSIFSVELNIQWYIIVFNLAVKLNIFLFKSEVISIQTKK